jgi:hypothetical protein
VVDNLEGSRPEVLPKSFQHRRYGIVLRQRHARRMPDLELARLCRRRTDRRTRDARYGRTWAHQHLPVCAFPHGRSVGASRIR